MQGATTAGTEFAQTVTGVVRYNQLAPVTETGLPTSASTTIDSGASVPITVMVTNTTNHVGYSSCNHRVPTSRAAIPPRRWSWRPEPPRR